MGVPILIFGVIVPARSALAALVRPLGVRILERDTRPVAVVDTELIESSKLCDGGCRCGAAALGFIVDAGFLARIECKTLGVASWPAERLRRERARAEFRGPIMLPFLPLGAAW